LFLAAPILEVAGRLEFISLPGQGIELQLDCAHDLQPFLRSDRLGQSQAKEPRKGKSGKPGLAMMFVGHKLPVTL
jgi:hypothetical protein